MSVKLFAENLKTLRIIPTTIVLSILVISQGTAQTITSPEKQNQEPLEITTDITVTDPENESTETLESLEIKSDSTKENSNKNNIIEKKKAEVEVVEEQEESTSIISFNFIYYILQKFKFSDILGSVTD